MDYALQSLYYFLRSFVNFILSINIADNISLGGIFFSVALLSGIFYYLGFRR